MGIRKVELVVPLIPAALYIAVWILGAHLLHGILQEAQWLSFVYSLFMLLPMLFFVVQWSAIVLGSLLAEQLIVEIRGFKLVIKNYKD